MIELSEIRGREFDWFSIDHEKSIALFSTAGFGFVSLAILASVRQHDELADSLECPNLGSDSVWDDICAYGLYVYDWNQTEKAYERLRIPVGEAKPPFDVNHQHFEVFQSYFSTTTRISNGDRFARFILAE